MAELNICPGRPTCKLCALVRPILDSKHTHPEEVVTLAYEIRANNQYFSNICIDPNYDKVILFGYGPQIRGRQSLGVYKN